MLVSLLEPHKWSNNRHVLEMQATLAAQSKGFCYTYVGIVAFLGILVKDGIRESTYQHKSIKEAAGIGMDSFQVTCFAAGAKQM